jgi:hypothetical protein
VEVLVPHADACRPPVVASGLRAPARDAKLDGITDNKNIAAAIADWAQSARSTRDAGSKIPEKFWLRAGPRAVPAPPQSRPFPLPVSHVVRTPALDTGKTALGGTSFRGERLDTAGRHDCAANVRPLPDTPGCNTGPADTTDEMLARSPSTSTTVDGARTDDRLAPGPCGSHAE